ncbi:TPM domain-containing protein [Marinobacter caseinilyticus]|uniref:TPM domain-containing protein n=1 Tax=Marinobacter caseinilyticus TaxID=2692195 RepID=UPI0014083605|nr:TPM domain-containing protein [Marinobacter caseinilyticus]
MGSNVRHSVLLAWVLTIFSASAALAQSAPEFPDLTGRVVDQADMLDSQTEQALSQMLEAHEQATTEQVVVVTLPDLQGKAIEDYGYQLGRHWGIGQKGEDNGALLIVAKQERQVRIEVGYGLEGRLTDATSATIINQIITPAFRQGSFSNGIVNGTAAMIQVLGGKPLAQPTQSVTDQSREKPSLARAALFFIIMMAVIFFVGGGRGRGGRSRGGAALLGGALLGASLGGRSGGFGGGGGGFGGGGASGGW